jgi:DNA adenine methylase
VQLLLDSIVIFSDTASMAYPGGKAGDGVYQRIISLMPPHEVYIEPFLGGGAIMRHKRPARLNIGVDLDPQVISSWQDPIARNGDTADAGSITSSSDTRFEFREGDGLAFLQSYPFTGKELVYCDPPYMLSTRSGKQYRFEMTDDQHMQLLEMIKALPCMVMISGYWTKLYAEALNGWTTFTYDAMTRGGHTAMEVVWMNYPNPIALHDYRYLGEDFRERERIKRKKQRWVRRLHTMPILERRALLAAIGEVWPGIPSPELTIPAGIAVSDDTISHR